MAQEKGDISLALYNYGSIEVRGWKGIWMQVNSQKGNATVIVHNEGIIKTGDDSLCIRVDSCGTNGTEKLYFRNSGTISTARPLVLSANAPSRNKGFEFSVENLGSGVIENTSEEGVALSIRCNDLAKKPVGTFKITNAGTLRAPGPVLDIAVSTDNRAPVALINTGVMESANPNAPAITATLTHNVPDTKKIMASKKFMGIAEAWIDQSGFYALPAGIKMHLQLRGYNWKNGDEVTVEEMTVESLGATETITQ